MTVAIVTDGGASLPADCRGFGDVTVVPLRVLTGALSGAAPAPVADPPPTLAEVLAAAPGTVRTSCPAPSSYLEAIERCHADSVLVCTVAAPLSGSYQAALIAARRTRVPVRVIDTGSAAGGQGLVVLAAARAARAGGGLDAVAAASAECASQVRLVGAIDSIAHIVASGRVPQSAAWAASRLGVHPVFELRGGRVRELWPTRSPRAADSRMLGCLRRAAVGRGFELHVSVLHVAVPERAQRLLNTVTAEYRPAFAYLSEFDAATAAHVGPGVVGLAWRSAPVGAF